MKKIIVLALVLTALATTAFSNNSDNINRQALNTFSKNYINPQDVQWESLDGYLKVTFKIDGQQLFAYYREDGEQFAVTRNILSTQLPISLSAELKSKCNNQWLTELFEISSNGETTYFATLNSADKVTVLRADASGNWSVFKKARRTAE
ncbi:MAG: hypothetical protein H0X41_02720 [Chitinophagaceae bacterium]|nr:hypothetical protein [Chitinophagaceae bacterium]